MKNYSKLPQKSKKKRLLVLGGTSSFAHEFIKSSLEDDFEVFATYRHSKPELRIENVSYMSLDIAKTSSIIRFLSDINGYRFTHVLNLIGSESKIDKFPSENSKDGDRYIQTYVTNLIYLIDNMFGRKRVSDYCNIIIISSRSARFGSRDRYYAVSKSALEGYVKSVGKFTKIQGKLNAVSVGLVKGSKMFIQMPKNLVFNHEKRSNNSLIELNEFTNSIYNLMNDKSLSSGQVIYLGPQYE